jgi:hypothetical protein
VSVGDALGADEDEPDDGAADVGDGDGFADGAAECDGAADCDADADDLAGAVDFAADGVGRAAATPLDAGRLTNADANEPPSVSGDRLAEGPERASFA